MKNVDDLPRVLHEAFYIAAQRPAGPGAWSTSPRTCSSRMGTYYGPTEIDDAAQELPPAASRATLRPIEAAVDLMLKAERPIFYTGGGVINSGPEASRAAARTGAS